MIGSAISLAFLSSLTLSYAHSPYPTPSHLTAETVAQAVTDYLPISTLPPSKDDYAPQEHLELRQVAAAGAAAQPAAGAGVAAQPAAGAGAGAAVQPVPGAAAQPVPGAGAAAQPVPVAGQPAVGVGGAGAVPAAAQPASINPGQVPPVTTVTVNSVIGGVTKQVPIVYTQKFSSIPDQGPTPAKGVIGLGTLTGKIGVINTAEAKKSSAVQRAAMGLGGTGIVIMSMLAALA